jgi:hypothetical protein
MKTKVNPTRKATTMACTGNGSKSGSSTSNEGYPQVCHRLPHTVEHYE